MLLAPGIGYMSPMVQTVQPNQQKQYNTTFFPAFQWKLLDNSI